MPFIRFRDKNNTATSRIVITMKQKVNDSLKVCFIDAYRVNDRDKRKSSS